MRSTFMGLETAKRGMYTQQSAIYVTGHNISNKNTPGYTRQRVNFEQTTPYPAASMNRPQMPGQLGTGVVDGTIQRIRDSFVDEQFRGENNKFGYYNTLAGSVRKMEDIMNEPSDFGLSKAMSLFWKSLQDLSTNPENEGARQVVIEQGKSVAETFKYLHSSLTTLRKDTKSELDATVREINSLAKQIVSVNQQISEVEPHGYLPNDLYDERDRLMDKLSSLVPIETKPVNYGGNSLDIAEGGVDVYIKIGGQSIKLIDDKETNELKLDGNQLKGEQGGSVTFDDKSEGAGKLAALIEAYGEEDPSITGLYPEMLDALDKFAFTFGKIFNDLHSKGYDLDGNQGGNFFDFKNMNPDNYKGAAGNIFVSITDPNKVAAASQPNEKGNGENALILADINSMSLENMKVAYPDGTEFNIDFNSFQSFYEGVIGDMAVKGQRANRLEHNTGVLLNSVDKNRRSISEVSLDEEFSNLIQFQHAYSASARMISTVDEMLDKIINGMGHVGR